MQDRWREQPKNSPAAWIPILSILDLVQNLWIGAGRGTCMHKDMKNIGLLLAFYLGFGYGPSNKTLYGGGVGLPEKQFIWNHGPGSVMAIHAFNYYHMPHDPDLLLLMGLKMMGAAYVNGMK